MAKDIVLADLSSVRRPVETVNGLPNALYTDPETLKLEITKELHTSWAGLAVGAEVPENGNTKSIEFLGIPLLLLRDKDGDVRVFQNIFRHRGMILVDAPRKIADSIRCPYHSWCYSTDRALMFTPHVGGGIKCLSIWMVRQLHLKSRMPTCWSAGKNIPCPYTTADRSRPLF